MENIIRCKACDVLLSTEDLKRKAPDWNYCSECRYQSDRQFNMADKDYNHGQLTSITLDGDTLTIEHGWQNNIDTDTDTDN